MSNRFTNILAISLLIFVFLIAFFSMKDDSATMDEIAHLPAGYSYLTQKDMRLNPEHPPLIKDLAAIPLLFIKEIKFPSEIKAWKEDINGQWDFGFSFLYHAGNPVDKMIFWGRVPMILLLVFLGGFLFYWAREFYGNKVALLVLFLFSFSPTFLAHGRLITTDVGAALGVVISTYFWLKFLKNPRPKNLILAGLTFGIAMLLKFSLILLVPFFAFITLIYAWFKAEKKPLFDILKYLSLALLIGVIGVVFIIWPVYHYHTLNYPVKRQLRDTQFLLSTTAIPKPLTALNIRMAQIPVLRPFSQYLLGLFLALNRGTSGNTTYFLGEISAAGWRNYFPIVYSIKEPLAFQILTALALLYIAWLIKKPFWQNTFQRLRSWTKSHFPEFTMLSFIGIYWITSLSSRLNIGVRHLLPVFPFTFILVSVATIKWLSEPFLKIKYLILGALILWQAISVISIYPYFLSYFNELAGGPDQGYIYTVNSNLDWGQDLKRLKKWANLRGIDKIYVDYFGGGDAQYYLKEKYAPWWGQRDPKEIEKGSYLAVSATFLEGGRGIPAPGFNQPSGYYHWLDKYQPIEKIGYSIFIYYID